MAVKLRLVQGLRVLREHHQRNKQSDIQLAEEEFFNSKQPSRRCAKRGTIDRERGPL